MNSGEAAGLRSPKTLDYMFKHLVELINMEDPVNFLDVEILVDATYKTQMQLDENHPDIVFAWMNHKNNFSQLNLNQHEISTVLKLFRGFFAMDNRVLSKQNADVLAKSFHEYVTSDATKKMNTTLWLTVIEICTRAM